MEQSQSQTQQTRENAQFQLRLPDDLKARIQAMTQATGRSLNSEIVSALLNSFMPCELAVRSAQSMMDYVRAGDDDLEQSTRVANMQHLFHQVGARAEIEYDPKTQVTKLTFKP